MDATLSGQSPPYTYPNPTRTFWLFPSILLKINAFPDAIWDLKREKKSRFELRSIVSKSMCLTIYATETNVK